MTATLGVHEIPGPKGLPLIGNVRDLDLAAPLDSLLRLAREYGPIYKLSTPLGDRLVVSGADLVADLVDDARFDKEIAGGLSNLKPREGESAGLFSSETQDPLWQRAHNILMAPFSLQAMRDYTPMMVDIAEQLADKWARLNPGEQVDVPADMTRLTLDTIALCGFGYRFNSFYRDTPHPFVEAMYGMLAEAQARLSQLPVPDPAEDPRPAAARREPGLHERPRRPDHRRAPRHGRRRADRRPARADAERGRQGER
jgi:cytochrome P450 / NADPH-cytochrome P450 reductase